VLGGILKDTPPGIDSTPHSPHPFEVRVHPITDGDFGESILNEFLLTIGELCKNKISLLKTRESNKQVEAK
jgi:hypothetical protein